MISRTLLLLCLTLLLQSPLLARTPEESIEKYFRMHVIDYKEGKLINWWCVQGSKWPKELKGFYLKKQKKGSDEWINLNKELLLLFFVRPQTLTTQMHFVL